MWNNLAQITSIEQLLQVSIAIEKMEHKSTYKQQIKNLEIYIIRLIVFTVRAHSHKHSFPYSVKSLCLLSVLVTWSYPILVSGHLHSQVWQVCRYRCTDPDTEHVHPGPCTCPCLPVKLSCIGDLDDACSFTNIGCLYAAQFKDRKVNSGLFTLNRVEPPSEWALRVHTHLHFCN